MRSIIDSTTQMFIDGPVGRLDCLVITPENNHSGVAIIAHPDPTNGGTYNNKVVQTIARVLVKRGYICYCPHVRGVGQSAGVFQTQCVADLQAIYQYLLTQHSNLPLILSGFSFGCSIISQLAMNVPHQKLILVAPAVTKYTVTIPNYKDCIVIHGEQDELITLEEVLAWAKLYHQHINIIPACTHLFHGKLVELQKTLEECLEPTTSK